MTRAFLMFSLTGVALLTIAPPSFTQYRPINAGPGGVIEGIGNTCPAGSRVSIIDNSLKGDEPSGGGFVAQGVGETQVVEEQSEPDGGFKPHDGGETRVVESRPEPNGGFKPISGETTSLTRRERPRRQAEWSGRSDDSDIDFSDPFFDDTVVVVPRQRFYPQPRAIGRGWAPSAPPSRGRDNWARPQYVPSHPHGDRGGVGFMGGARRVSPGRGRQLNRSFR